MSVVQEQRRAAHKVNILLKLTPTQLQHAIDRAEEGKRLLKQLESKAPEFTPAELALLLDFLPDNAIDLTESEVGTSRDA